MMRKKAKQEAKSGGGSSWMVTFSDLSTLLLTFFVLLLSMSSLDTKAFRSSFRNFNASTGILQFKEHDSVNIAKDMVIKDLCKNLESVHSLDIRDISEGDPGQASSNKEFNLLVSSGSGVWVNRGQEKTK
ncbi:MAG: flagellar motor protein MotB, partial [Desulforhabdus sp.]|nr:flagellar motor protein MotB [Desulforhabdus sp.]